MMVMVTHSLFNAGMARLDSPAVYLSAFAVAKGLAHLLKSPAVMSRQTVTALVVDKKSYHKVGKFLIIITASVVIMMSIISFTGLARWIFRDIMGLKGRVLDEAITILQILTVFPIAEIIRNIMQGLAIKHNVTYLTTIATGARIIFVFIMVISIDKLSALPGAVIAGLMFLGAVFIEAFVMFTGVRLITGKIQDGISRLSTKLPDADKNWGEKLSYKFIIEFFYPLIITAIIKFICGPIINTGLGRTVNPEIAISAYAVGWSLGLIVTSPLLMYHQIPIYFLNNRRESYLEIKRFNIILGFLLSTIMACLAFTDLGYYILTNWIGATNEISLLAMDVLKVMTIIPLIRAFKEFYWGVLMKKHLTRYIGRGKIVGLMALIITVITMVIIDPANPALIGIMAQLANMSAEALYLYMIVVRKVNVYENLSSVNL